MTALTTSANLVELSTLAEESTITTTLERSEIEMLLAADSSRRLWFELGVEGEAEARSVTLELADDDLRTLLAGSTGDDVLLALDGEELAGLLEAPDVEAHGLRGALGVSIAVATAAVAAPSALAATQQSIGTAATTQAVGAAATSQEVGTAAATQVSRQIVSQQIARGASTKPQRASAYKYSQLSILRAGAVR